MDYWLFSSPPSLPRSVFLSIIHLFFVPLAPLYPLLPCLSAKAMDGKHPLKICQVSQSKRPGETQMFVTAAWYERI